MGRRTILTVNCHEGWIYQLRHLDADIHILHGAPGKAVGAWDLSARPVPANATLLPLAAFDARAGYDAVIAHNMSDLFLLEEVDAPKLLILHTTLEHRARQEGARVAPAAFASAVKQYLQIKGIHAAAGTPMKAASWNLTDDVLGLAIDEHDNEPWTGEQARGLRVASQITQKRETLNYIFHEQAFVNIPIRIVGRNPEIPGALPAASHEELLNYYKTHRFFVHTAAHTLEDGYNMAMAEAMAAGMPVIGNAHPTSPIVNGKNGFLAQTPAELAARAELLLKDRELARQLGAAARETILRMFPVAQFIQNLECALTVAERAWSARRRSLPRALSGRLS